jgi:lipoprotein-releasing system permease protein
VAEPDRQGASPAGRGADGVVWWIAARYLFGARSRLLSGTARSALGSTALGVAAMVISMALMSGYSDSVLSQLLRAGPLVVSLPGDAAEDPVAADRIADGLRPVRGVAGVSVTVAGTGLLASNANRAGVDVWTRGVLPGASSFGATEGQLEHGDVGIESIVLGRELQRTLDVAEGDPVRLTTIGSPGSTGPRMAYRTLAVAGAFETGYSEYDRSYAVVHRDTAVAVGGGRVVLEVTTAAGASVSEVREQIEGLVGADAMVTDWRLGNRDIRAAFRLQEWGLFLILGLIVLVSTFNIASALVVLVRERGRDTAVLAALGLGPRRVQRVFLLGGLSLGAVGTALGIGLGALVSVIVTRYELVRFDSGVAEIYFISSVPFDVQALDLLAVAAFSLLVTGLACWLPARMGAAIEPARALRWE